MIKIELLTNKNFELTSLDNYQRRQVVQKIYVKNNDEYVLVEQSFVDDWDLQKKREVASDISSDKNITYLAIKNNEVIGFVSVLKHLVQDYMILDSMQVSALYRGQGIGKLLFELSKKEAKKAGAKGLYISACPSEETIGFYKTVGAKITKTPIKEFAENEPYDLQMVCEV